MNPARIGQLTVSLLLGWAFMAPAAVEAQNSFARARAFYESAAYEEALQILDGLKDTPSAAPTEIAAYQVFCLVALGRNAEASHAIESIVRADPLFRPSDLQASPRVRAFFDDVRRPLLPEVVRLSYARAKKAFEKKDMPTAGSEFDRVIQLIDELGSSDDGVADLRTLAVGFRELTVLATAPPPAPAEPARPTEVAEAATAPKPAPAGPKIYGVSDMTVVRPVVIDRPVPPWEPQSQLDAKRSFHGVFEIVVDERGRVTSAVLSKPVHPAYDEALLKALRTWTFRPATKGGQPVAYRYSGDINLGPNRYR